MDTVGALRLDIFIMRRKLDSFDADFSRLTHSSGNRFAMSATGDASLAGVKKTGARISQEA